MNYTYKSITEHFKKFCASDSNISSIPVNINWQCKTKSIFLFCIIKILNKNNNLSKNFSKNTNVC